MSLKGRMSKAATGTLGWGIFQSEVKPLMYNGHEGVKKILKLPINGSISEFERALFADPSNLRFVQVVLTTQSIVPTSIAIDYGFQTVAFIDMVNDINGSTDMKEYLKGFKDVAESLGRAWLSSKAEDVSLGFTLVYDPEDAVLPVEFGKNTSMSLLNQLNYKVSADRIRRLSDRFYFDKGGNLVIEYTIVDK